MSIEPMNAQPVPRASCPFEAPDASGGSGAVVMLQTKVDYACPRLQAPDAPINPWEGEKVPDPDVDDPELLYCRAELTSPSSQAILSEDEAPRELLPGVQEFHTRFIRRLICIPGQREGCRG